MKLDKNAFSAASTYVDSLGQMTPKQTFFSVVLKSVDGMWKREPPLLAWRLTGCSLRFPPQAHVTSWFRPLPAWSWGRWSKVERDCLNSNSPCSSVRGTKRRVTWRYVDLVFAVAPVNGILSSLLSTERLSQDLQTPSEPSGAETLQNFWMK